MGKRKLLYTFKLISMIEPQTKASLTADQRAAMAYVLDSFCREYNLPLTRKGEWRAVKAIRGEINGLPGSRGVIRATDGIECYIVREDNTLFHGHVASFIPDEDESEFAASAKTSHPKRERLFEGLFD